MINRIVRPLHYAKERKESVNRMSLDLLVNAHQTLLMRLTLHGPGDYCDRHGPADNVFISISAVRGGGGPYFKAIIFAAVDGPTAVARSVEMGTSALLIPAGPFGGPRAPRAHYRPLRTLLRLVEPVTITARITIPSTWPTPRGPPGGVIEFVPLESATSGPAERIFPRFVDVNVPTLHRSSLTKSRVLARDSRSLKIIQL